MADIKNPKVGQNVIQYLVSNTKLSNEQLKSIAVQGDMGGTSVIQGNGGTIIHRKNISLQPQVYKAHYPDYIFGAGLGSFPLVAEGWDSDTVTKMFGKLPPQQYPKTISIYCINRADPLIALFPNALGPDETGNWPVDLEWNGPDVIDQTILSSGPGIKTEITHITQHFHNKHTGDEPIQQLTWTETTNTISLNLSAGLGVGFSHTPPSSTNNITIDCHIATYRGLLASPVPGDVAGTGYNYWLISGLFWGDCEHDHFQPSTANYYNYYDSIKSVECIMQRQVEVPVLDPETGQPTGETETITEDYSTGDVYMSLFDVTPCLSCETSGGIYQWKEEIRWKDASGQDAQGVNHYQTHLQIAPAYRTYLNVLTGRPSSGDYILSSHNGDVSWEVNSGGGPTPPTPSSGGMPWPNYANLDNSTGNVIMNYTRYQAGAGGGWLRISYKGQMTDDCYYVKIGPDGTSDPTIGLWRVQTGCGYYGQIGNTWLLPVPPNNYIYVSFPNSVATAWFDSSLSPDSPPPIPPSAHGYPDDINRNFVSVNDLKSQAERYYQECIGYSDYNDANEYAGYAEDCATDADRYATDSEEKNAVLVQYGINDYTTKVTNTRNNAYLAEGYALQARQYADSLPH